ncbi:hypothetical protein MRB53_039425 [Persea americana]|nr:hypothetical protein MRB53_039425 [Persea americana]
MSQTGRSALACRVRRVERRGALEGRGSETLLMVWHQETKSIAMFSSGQACYNIAASQGFRGGYEQQRRQQRRHWTCIFAAHMN